MDGDGKEISLRKKRILIYKSKKEDVDGDEEIRIKKKSWYTSQKKETWMEMREN